MSDAPGPVPEGPTVVLDPGALDGDTARVEGDLYRHLFRARRLAVGDPVRVVDGHGRARRGRVEEVDRQSARLALGEEVLGRDPVLHLELLVATPKKERLSWLVEKATELGVAAVRLLASERSPREPGGGTLDRLERVAAAALAQSGGARLPEITGVHPWEELPELLAPLESRWLLHTAEGDPGSKAWDGEAWDGEGRTPASLGLLVGPEGGWSDGEVARLRELSCRPLWLGERVLRVETAAVVAAAAALLGGPAGLEALHQPKPSTDREGAS